MRAIIRGNLAMLSKISCAALGIAMISTQLQGASSNAQERQTIIALRADNNLAIAAHDLDGVMRIAADDYVSIGGNSGIERSRAESRHGWAEEFASEGFDRYVRTTTQVEIGERKGVLRAAEMGRWEGFDRKLTGASRPFGRYFVHWSKGTGQWRVVSETYVTLGCRGTGC